MNLSEWHIYGSSRLGIYQTSINMAYRHIRIEGGEITDSTTATVVMPSFTLFGVERGAKRYELTNHLGNVLVVVTDKRISVCSGDTVNYYTADVVTANDYSPFGAPLAGRSYTAPNSDYRFHFNGKETDEETQTQDYGFRIYDYRLGKFLCVDPLTGGYPWWTPYQFAGNRPIDGIDLDGLEFLDADDARVEFKYGRLQLKTENFITGGNFLSKNLNHKYWNPNELGYNIKVADIQFNIKTIPQATDIPGEQLPNAWKNQTANNRSVKTNKAGQNKGYGGLSIPHGNKTKTMAKGVATAEALIFVLEQGAYLSEIYDNKLTDEHRIIAEKAFKNVQSALADGLIDKKYQNKESLANIMNVVLQGENNTDDKEIYNIGMKIFDKYNPKPEPTVAPTPNPAGSATPTDNTYQVPPVTPIKTP